MSTSNPVNFLDLCRRAAVECGVASNSAIATALPTVVSATGSLGRIVNWVSDAWTDIQMDMDGSWDWMRSSNVLGQGVSFPTFSGVPSYPVGTGFRTVGIDPEIFGHWDRESFRNYTTANSSPIWAIDGFGNPVLDGSGNPVMVSAHGGPYGNDEVFMEEISFDAWRDGYMFGAQRSVRTRPYVIAVGPDQSLNLGPPPNSNYTVTGDFFVAPTDMVADADIPIGLPKRFYMLPVYRAMIKYGGYEAAPEVSQRGTEENAGMYSQLTMARAPRISWGMGALA